MTKKPKGEKAARIRQRKFRLLESLEIPPEALPGSLALTHRKCGKPNCRCAKGDKHPLWSLTFMDQGKKRVERIPKEWVDEVRQRVQEGKDFKKALAEIFVANADLLVLRRQQGR
jgi:hypothetical protein